MVGADHTVRIDRDGAVAWIRLNRPDRHNAQIPLMWHELRRAGEELVAAGDVRCAVIIGNGPSFSSGLDRRARANGEFTGPAMGGRPADDGPTEITDADLEVTQAAFRWPTEAPFVTIAAVHGYALGAGAELALACDLRVLSDDAQLALPEAELGMMPDMGGCERLAQLVGYARAVDLSLTCRRLDAAQALELGLATSVVAREELESRAASLATLIAGRRAETVEYVKRAVGAAARGDRDGSFALAREGALALIASRPRH